jgi:hypothetical protein
MSLSIKLFVKHPEIILNFIHLLHIKPTDEPGTCTTIHGGRTPQQKMDQEDVPLHKPGWGLLLAKINLA